MAAAAGGAAAGGLIVDLVLQGTEDMVAQLRQAAGRFDDLRTSIQSANDAVSELRSQLSSGATAGTFGAIAAQFRSIGLSAEDLVNIAAEFRERLFRDPITIGAFGRSVLPARLGGPQDEMGTLREGIRLLREARTAEERLLRARKLQLEPLLPLVDLEQRHLDALLEAGQQRGNLVDQELRSLRAERDALRTRREIAAERLAIQRERSFLPTINRLDEIEARNAEWRARGGLLGEFWRRLGYSTPGEAAGAGGAGPQSQTEALRDNTRALATLREELANAGVRGRTAVPGGLRGDALQKALETHALQLGEFSLGAF